MARLSGAARQKRDALVRETVQSLNRGTPDDVLLKKIVSQYGYSLPGAQVIMREARMFAEKEETAA